MLQLFAQISACEHKKDIRKCQEFEMISKRVSPRHEKISPEFAGVSACHAKTSKHFAGASACHEKTAEHFRLSLSSARKNINILRESQFVRKIIGDSRLRKQLCVTKKHRSIFACVSACHELLNPSIPKAKEKKTFSPGMFCTINIYIL